MRDRKHPDLHRANGVGELVAMLNGLPTGAAAGVGAVPLPGGARVALAGIGDVSETDLRRYFTQFNELVTIAFQLKVALDDARARGDPLEPAVLDLYRNVKTFIALETSRLCREALAGTGARIRLPAGLAITAPCVEDVSDAEVASAIFASRTGTAGLGFAWSVAAVWIAVALGATIAVWRVTAIYIQRMDLIAPAYKANAERLNLANARVASGEWTPAEANDYLASGPALPDLPDTSDVLGVKTVAKTIGVVAVAGVGLYGAYLLLKFLGERQKATA